MFRRLLMALLFNPLVFMPIATTSTAATPSDVSDQDIADAYLYLLGRLLVLRQENIDFRDEGFKWNEIIFRTPGGVAWANPNLDVAYSEAWVAVDENTPVILEVPKIEGGRYYSWQMLNGWGETVLNINERTFPDHPFGKYALVLKGSNPPIPEGALRVELPSRKSRVLARVELGSDPEAAIRLQKQFKLTPTRTPKIAPLVVEHDFPNDKLPGAEAFDQATAILESEPDINPGMEPLQAKVRAVEALAKSSPEGERQESPKPSRRSPCRNSTKSSRNSACPRTAGHGPRQSATTVRTISLARRST